MSARKLDSTPSFPRSRAASRETNLTLATQAVRIHKNGIEFRSPSPLDTWVEMTVELESPHATRKLECSGIVVSCAGTRDTGYVVSMLFTGMNSQSQEQLSLLAHS
jgi:hypothetical protein